MDNNVSKDKDLLEYPTLDKMLEAEFYPGNYNPTQDQAKQLIKAASLSAIRWAELHKHSLKQDIFDFLKSNMDMSCGIGKEVEIDDCKHMDMTLEIVYTWSDGREEVRIPSHPG